jgi:hypothetical protein
MDAARTPAVLAALDYLNGTARHNRLICGTAGIPATFEQHVELRRHSRYLREMLLHRYNITAAELYEAIHARS